MKVIPEILGREQTADVKLYGLPLDMLYGIVFENEQEANEYKELLEELMAKKLSCLGGD